MDLSAERLNRAKKDIEGIVAAFKTGDYNSVSQEGRRLVEELSALDDAGWNLLLASLEDGELRDLLGSVRQRMSKEKDFWRSIDPIRQIRNIEYQFLFDISQQSLMVFLRFNNVKRESLLDQNQDMENTLWVGAAVVEVVSEAMKAMDGTLNPEAQRVCTGSDFEKNLKKVEDAVGEIRRIFNSVHGTDKRDKT